MRPDFSVRHSPRLTNRNGTPTRSAPPTIAARKATRTSAVTGAPSTCGPSRRAACSARADAAWQVRAPSRARPAAGLAERPRVPAAAIVRARSRELLLDLVDHRPPVDVLRRGSRCGGRRSLPRMPIQSSPRSASLARISTNAMPCSTCTDASGRPSRRCSRLPAAPKPPNRIATGMIANGDLAGDERDQDAGVAVAGDQRRVRVGVHRGDLDRAGEAGAGAADRAGEQHRRFAGRPTSCAVRGLPPTTRTEKPLAVKASQRPISEAGADAEDEAPVHVGAADAGDAQAFDERARRRLVQASPDRAAALRRAA